MLNSPRLAKLITSLHLIDLAKQQRCCSSNFTKTSKVNKFTERTHTCGDLTRNDIGKRVELYGWVSYTRFDNKIIALRDSYGTVQCIVSKDKLTKSFRKAALHNESVVKVSGHVQARPDSQKNDSQAQGEIEVLADNVDLISDARKDLPILTRQTEPEQTHTNRLKYRYLDIRSQRLQEALRFRSEVCQIFRSTLLDLGFVECETPTLFRRTPGGANEFVVPTQLPGLFYGLTQSPQQLKQLLMIGGLDRYFQICRCYRDEATRPDRQPEFTQLDIELSFTSQDHIIDMITHLIHELFDKLRSEWDAFSDQPSRFAIDRISYQEAFGRYGTDKPDTRFGWLLKDTGVSAISMTIPHPIGTEVVSQCLDELKVERQEDTLNCDVMTTTSNVATKIVAQSQTEEARKIMGQLRLKLAAQLQRQGQQIYDSKFKFLWVTDFPLFAKKEGSDELESNHHPFTAPTEETAQYLATEPLQVIGQHYDLVLNGQEIGGGSIRIHRPEIQRLVFEDILKLSGGTFEYFTEALSSGCPPHGGIALGLDRFIAILLGKQSIRDVIAFPKSNSGRDLMSHCPHELDTETRTLYHLGPNK